VMLHRQPSRRSLYKARSVMVACLFLTAGCGTCSELPTTPPATSQPCPTPPAIPAHAHGCTITP
jgi:hypothetical protein